MNVQSVCFSSSSPSSPPPFNIFWVTKTLIHIFRLDELSCWQANALNGCCVPWICIQRRAQPVPSSLNLSERPYWQDRPVTTCTADKTGKLRCVYSGGGRLPGEPSARQHLGCLCPKWSRSSVSITAKQAARQTAPCVCVCVSVWGSY